MDVTGKQQPELIERPASLPVPTSVRKTFSVLGSLTNFHGDRGRGLASVIKLCLKATCFTEENRCFSCDRPQILG
ncbi:hypothetical protein XENOCAPTIV_014445 [Xenoophorus captivus]|uniref:Uncharacterized protein n=1 Tax=Xenoophorus captivus TaxID=1517983 RepID=A0ABV0QRV1_9TELE